MARQPITFDQQTPSPRAEAQPLAAWSEMFPFLRLELIYAEARLDGDRVHVRGARRRYEAGRMVEERFQGEADAEQLLEAATALQRQLLDAMQAMQQRMLGMMFPWLPWGR